ncbi:MAG: transposase [Fibrobacteres bacterium]|nr:transposase [Fibrobacterota bacterium]
MQPNSVLEKSSVAVRMEAEEVFFQTAQWQKLFDEVDYRAGSWKSSRRVIVKAERNPLGPNTRYVATNLSGEPRHIYAEIYCARGENGESIQGDADRLVRIEAVPRRVPGKLDAPFDVHPGICPAAHLACDRIEG